MAPPPGPAPSPAVTASAPAAAPPPESPSVDLGRFERVLDVPVRSLALGEPRVAVLGDEPWMLEKNTWKKLPLADKLKAKSGERDDGRIFFGRDDRPRIMGTRFRDGGTVQLYLRYRNDRWNDERNEIAKLRDPPAAGLFGVLGHADPEVVCKMGDDCIIKRRTGWKMMPAGPGRPRVELALGTAFALHADSVVRLDDDHVWTPIGAPAPFRDPAGVWGTKDDVWVSEPAASRLHRFHGGAWTTIPAPFDSPRGLWGTAANDVWLAGGGGLAHFDGTTWSRVAGVAASLAEVAGREGEVWAAGEGGVFRRKSR
jgi:hypothetical protein